MPPIDLSPFRMLVDFFAGGSFALVSDMAEARATTGGSGVNGWLSFVDPGISGDWHFFRRIERRPERWTRAARSVAAIVRL